MADEVRITLEPIRLQALNDIALLKVAYAADDTKKAQFINILTNLVEELNRICGAGMGIDVRFSGGGGKP